MCPGLIVGLEAAEAVAATAALEGKRGRWAGVNSAAVEQETRSHKKVKSMRPGTFLS